MFSRVPGGAPNLTAAADTRRCLLDSLLAEALEPGAERELEAAE
jgi:hypothetical protein